MLQEIAKICLGKTLIRKRHQTGGTGETPVPAQAKACGYPKLLFAGNSV
jgi:hypothetical protein